MSSTQNIIRSLAQSMGVSHSDVMMMAQSIANDFVKDGVCDVYVNGDSAFQCDLVEAYAVHQVKKFREFHSTYLTNPQAAQDFQSCVYELVKPSLSNSGEVDETQR